MNAMMKNVEWQEAIGAALWAMALTLKLIAKALVGVAWIVVLMAVTLTMLVLTQRLPRFLKPKWL